MVITKALYGLKSSGAAWRSLFGSEVDVLETLNAELSQRYQGSIGVLGWAVEIGTIDILP
jgi:hypothetical protein